MITVEKCIVIDVPVEDVFAYANDPRHMPEYFVEVHIDKVKDIQRLPDGRLTFTAVGKILGVSFETKTEQTEIVPNECAVVQGHSPLANTTSTLRFERLEGRKTRVSTTDEISLHGGPLAKLGESFLTRYFDHGAEMTLEAAKAHIEAGTPAQPA